MEPVEAIPYPGEREHAPGRLALVQRFVNTVDYEHGREMLSAPGRLHAGLTGRGPLPAGARRPGGRPGPGTPPPGFGPAWPR